MSMSLFAAATGVLSLDVSLDGRWLIAGDGDGMLSFWDTQTNQMQQQIKTGDAEFKSVVFSPDNTAIASGSFALGDTSIQLWDALRMSCFKVLPPMPLKALLLPLMAAPYCTEHGLGRLGYGRFRIRKSCGRLIC